MSTLKPGTIIGTDFEVLRKLSEGGMGAVYVVRQMSTGADRALKVMLPAIAANEALRAKFLREARIGSKIDSEHVVQVLAAGIDEAIGVPWLVMELLDGEDLAARVRRRGAFDRDEALELLGQLVHGIGSAHDVGIVHRDLKPENVFLARSKRRDAGVVVKVLDFGIAKVTSDATTHGSMAIGSPLWMAPEQASTGVEINAATDVWALGLIAFFVLTAKIFWRAAEHEATPIAIIKEMCFEPIPSASSRARELGCADALPEGFDAWFGRCVTRGERFRTARDALGALEQIAGRRPSRVSGVAVEDVPAEQAAPPPAKTVEAAPLPAFGARALKRSWRERTEPIGDAGTSASAVSPRNGPAGGPGRARYGLIAGGLGALGLFAFAATQCPPDPKPARSSGPAAPASLAVPALDPTITATSTSASPSVTAPTATAPETAREIASASPSVPGDTKALKRELNAAMNKGDNPRAIELANECIARTPEDAMCHLYKGSAYMSLGKMKEARAAFDDCVRRGKGAQVQECVAFGGKK